MAATLNRVIMTMAIVTIQYREGGEGYWYSSAAVIRIKVTKKLSLNIIIYLRVEKRIECHLGTSPARHILETTHTPSNVFASILNAQV